MIEKPPCSNKRRHVFCFDTQEQCSGSKNEKNNYNRPIWQLNTRVEKVLRCDEIALYQLFESNKSGNNFHSWSISRKEWNQAGVSTQICSKPSRFILTLVLKIFT